MSNEEFWTKKLGAYLHDPPCKALNIGEHENIAEQIQMREQVDREKVGEADRTAAACDRFPFPRRKATSCFTAEAGNTFIHPFCAQDNARCEYEFAEKITDSTRGVILKRYLSALQEVQGGIDGDAKQRSFLYWRRWRDEACKKHNEIAFLPADTRIPDHTIWNHLDVTSAFAGCTNPQTGKIEPALLLFQAGPVQGFIAAARSTRDLWSGSYMLSWLIGNALKAVTDEIGPDAIMFPALRGNGIFDILNRNLYDNLNFANAHGSEDTLWQRMYGDNDSKLLNPTLPNRFLAIVPAWRAKELAAKAEAAFCGELKKISDSSWHSFQAIAEAVGENVTECRQRWDNQVALLPEISWQVLPVDTEMKHIRQWAAKLPGVDMKDFDQLLNFLQNEMSQADKDERYYADAEKRHLSNWGITWSLHVAMVEYALSARRNLKDFAAFKTDQTQEGCPKDALTGKEETIGSENLWNKLKKQDKVFRENEGPYGAISIIKRLWCQPDGYLRSAMKEKAGDFRQKVSYDSVPDVAEGNADKCSPYVAVIAMDGDEMGKWLSGAKSARFKEILTGKALEYFRDNKLSEAKRLLYPSWHLQFSEALSNFSNHVAEKVVNAFAGQLIYAGGDDVLVILPADKAVACSFALRSAFRGDKEEFARIMDSGYKTGISIEQRGFVKCDGLEFMMPGPGMDVSCGIAIAHKNYPLQHIVNEARKAESRAKNEYGRGAFAMSLIKRSGEIVEWGAKWQKEVWELYNYYTAERRKKEESRISARFPYALAALLAPYDLDKEQPDNESLMQLLNAELAHVLEQQVEKEIREQLAEKSVAYLETLRAKDKNKEDFLNLYLAAAFIERDRQGGYDE